MSSGALIVLTTVADAPAAEILAEKIVAAKLAACVQILPAMRSIYIWDNAVQNETENLLLIKTLSEKYAELERFIRENHSYDVPEIIALSAAEISDSYFGWLQNSLA